MTERWDTVFRALAATPRRHLIASLLEVPPGRELSLPEAANPPSLLRDPELLYSELVHSHLPILEEASLIEWKREPLCAKRGPKFEEAAVIVESVYQNAGALPSSLRDGCQLLEAHHRGHDP